MLQHLAVAMLIIIVLATARAALLQVAARRAIKEKTDPDCWTVACGPCDSHKHDNGANKTPEETSP